MSSRTLKRLHKFLFFGWLVPGIPASLLLRNSLAWVVFLSVYAILIGHFIEWRQEEKDEAS